MNRSNQAWDTRPATEPQSHRNKIESLQIFSVRSLCLCASVVLLLLPGIAAGQKAVTQVSVETARLKAIVPSLKLPEKDEAAYLEQVAKVEEAFHQSRNYLGLMLLQRVEAGLLTDQYRLSKSELEKQGTEAFEREWQRLGVELTASKNQRSVPSSPSLPVAVQAILDRSQTQVQPYYQSGRLYGLNTTIDSGLYYLGLATAHYDFAVFCQGLRFSRQPIPLRLRSLEPELSKLEAEILQAYKQSDVGKQQSAYNQVNASLKMALELNQEKRFGGALLQYLEVSRQFLTIRQPLVEVQPIDQLKKRSEAMRTRFSASKTDHSIGLLYVETAQAQIEAAERQAEEAAQRTATIILTHILPRYLTITEKIR